MKDVLKSLDQSVLNALETIQPYFTLTIHGFIADIIKIAYGLGRWQYKSHLDSDFYTSYLRIKGNEQTNEIQKAKASGWHVERLKKAKELRQKELSLSQEELADKIKDELNLRLSERTIVSKISKWERSGDLSKKLPQTA